MKNINRLHRLSARIEEHLSQFEEIDLKGDGSSGLCCSDYGSRGPTLYVSGRKDSKVYDMPKSGKAKVSYRVRSKGVDYRGEDGEESYRTEIEVESIEPVDLEAVVEGYEFKRGDRLGKMVGMKAPVIFKDSNLSRGIAGKMQQVREIDKIKGPNLKAALQPKKEKILKSMRANMKDVVARRRAVYQEDADTWKGSIGTAVPRGSKKHYGLADILAKYEFGDRARDAGGRFAPGQNVSADEMADAYVKPKKKKAALLAGAGVAGVTAAMAGRSPAISQGVGRLLRSAV